MSKLINPFWDHHKNYTELVSDNHKETAAFKEKILSMLTLIGGILLLLPLLVVPFSDTKADIIHVYLSVAFIYLGIFSLFRLPVMKKYTIYGLYIGFSIFFLLSIFLSITHSPHMRATILLGAFCIMPLGFIDRPNHLHQELLIMLFSYSGVSLFSF